MEINNGAWEIQYKKGEKCKMRMGNRGHYILSTPDENQRAPEKMAEVREIAQVAQIGNRIVKVEMQYKIENRRR